MDFKLNLSIDYLSLREIKKAGLKITIAKAVSIEKPNVAWLVFDPFQGNTVEWTEEFGIFASASNMAMNGANIKRISELFPAQDGASYSFGKDCVFSGPATDQNTLKGSFKINNQVPSDLHRSLLFGLEQKACINNVEISPSPLNIASVMSMMNVTFTPFTKVFVWLQNEYTYGTVLTKIESSQTNFTFGGDVNEISIVFDPNTARFIQQNK